jgi:hypothetical protein
MDKWVDELGSGADGPIRHVNPEKHLHVVPQVRPRHGPDPPRRLHGGNGAVRIGVNVCFIGDWSGVCHENVSFQQSGRRPPFQRLDDGIELPVLV